MECKHCGKALSPPEAMFCWNCGQQQSENENQWRHCQKCGKLTMPQGVANYCWFCGSSLIGDPEVCKILFEYRDAGFGRYEGTFVAQATGGPLGEYIVARSETFQARRDPRTREVQAIKDDADVEAAWAALVKDLEGMGWEKYGEGDEWYTTLFQHRAT